MVTQNGTIANNQQQNPGCWPFIALAAASIVFGLMMDKCQRTSTATTKQNTEKYIPVNKTVQSLVLPQEKTR